MIMVQSTFQLDAKHKKAVIDLMKKMTQMCREERGCLSYEYYEGLTDSCQIILLQEWENADCLQDHYQTDHMADFLDSLSKFLESPVTTRSYASRESVTPNTPATDDLPKPEQTIH